jgi:hypothetical protein
VFDTHEASGRRRNVARDAPPRTTPIAETQAAFHLT